MTDPVTILLWLVVGVVAVFALPLILAGALVLVIAAVFVCVVIPLVLLYGAYESIAEWWRNR